jgi:hypothetical protein
MGTVDSSVNPGEAGAAASAGAAEGNHEAVRPRTPGMAGVRRDTRVASLKFEYPNFKK